MTALTITFIYLKIVFLVYMLKQWTALLLHSDCLLILEIYLYNWYIFYDNMLKELTILAS